MKKPKSKITPIKLDEAWAKAFAPPRRRKVAVRAVPPADPLTIDRTEAKARGKVRRRLVALHGVPPPDAA